jgi:predicted CopG family antitoxin
MKTTIQISNETRDELNALKVHPREPYEEVIRRLLEFYRSK